MGNAKIFLIFVLTVIVIENIYALNANCPTASRIASCSPQCKENSGCQGSKICCSNICGTKSCVDQYQYSSDGNKGYKGSSSKGSTGTYCGNVKCQPNEKCELDRSTKREKCVRG
ncbi:WAP, Kazal, immunoglobulin, Kunitz and NTR domain-containing protein [Asbolus verrucosus]|uniref:WAP, Kazal, immunoglobulin, Kunitz and NTR domain-containing protein n=1 Tax=Asbolus verrucosus TaxID=1661398 RepID=A0A482VWE0_ASBVE|nr:WAP, Kazal, immunoglobulin, Kunitz and NTR domain-containing protein [Asbolus verrucosus]